MKKILCKYLFVLFFSLNLFSAEEFLHSIPFETDLYLQKQGFSLGYSFKYRQAVWVTYTLTAEQLQSKQVKRRDRFKPDPQVNFRPVRPRDYSKSGYDKGHLAPGGRYDLFSAKYGKLFSNDKYFSADPRLQSQHLEKIGIASAELGT